MVFGCNFLNVHLFAQLCRHFLVTAQRAGHLNCGPMVYSIKEKRMFCERYRGFLIFLMKGVNFCILGVAGVCSCV